MAFGLIAFIVQAVFVAVTTAHQYRKQKEAQRRALEQRLEQFGNVRDLSAGDTLPEVYGDAAVHGHIVRSRKSNGTKPISDILGEIQGFSRSGDFFSGDGTNSIGRIKGESGLGAGHRGQYLYVEESLAVGTSGARALQVLYGDRSGKAGGDVYDHVIADIGAPGAVLGTQTATGQGSDPAANRAEARGLGQYHSVIVYKYEVDDPRFSGPAPRTLYFMRQEPRRGLEAGGTFAATTSDTRNAVDQFIHYYTKSIIGPERPDEELHLPSLAVAKTRCDRVVRVAADNPPATATSANPAWTGMENHPYWGEIDWSQTDSHPGQDRTSSIYPTGDVGRTLRRHEANGTIQSTLSFSDVIGMFEEVVPGAKTFVDLNGKRRLVVPDSETPEAMQSVGTLNEDDCLEPPQISYPGADELYNQYIMRFRDADEDFAVNTVTVPTPGSGLDVRLLAEDGGIRRSRTIDLPLTSNYFHAASNGMNRILSEREETIRMVGPTSWLNYAPGDVVAVSVPSDNYSVWGLIDRVLPLTDRPGVEILAQRFSIYDYKYYPCPATANPPRPSAFVPLPLPDNVTAALESGKRRVLVNWEIPRADAIAVTRFNLRVKRDSSIPTSVFEPLAEVPNVPADSSASTLRYTFPHTLNLNADDLQFGVQTEMADGRRSAFVDAIAVSIPVSTTGTALLAAPTNVAYADGTLSWTDVPGQTNYIVNYHHQNAEGQWFDEETVYVINGNEHSPDFNAAGRYRGRAAVGTAADRAGEFSPFVEFDFGATPAKITGLTAILDGEAGGDDILLGWTADPNATTYEIEEIFNEPLQTDTARRDFFVDNTSHQIFNRDDGDYRYRVRGFNGDLPGEWSDQTAPVTVNKAGRPGKIAGVMAELVAGTVNDVLVSWNSDANAATYRIRRINLETGSSTFLHENPPTMFTVEDEGDGRQQYEVQGTTAGGLRGEWSDPFVITLDALPKLSNVEVAVENRRATISFIGDADEYEILILDELGQRADRERGAATKYTSTNLSGGMYTVTVQAFRTGVGGGPVSDAQSFTIGSALAAPTGLQWNANAMHPDRGQLQFNVVAGASGYRVERTGPNDGDVEVQDNTEYTGPNDDTIQLVSFDDLDLGAHDFKVATQDGTLIGPYAELTNVDISSDSFNPPADPTGVSLTFTADGRPSLSWTNP